jgi:hypothetical protein
VKQRDPHPDSDPDRAPAPLLLVLQAVFIFALSVAAAELAGWIYEDFAWKGEIVAAGVVLALFRVAWIFWGR